MNYNDKEKFYVIDCLYEKYKDATDLIDFYEKSGVYAFKPNDKEYKIDVTAVHINTEFYHKLEETIRKNGRKKHKELTDHGFESAFGWEMLMFAPCYDDDVPMDKIYIDKEKFLVKGSVC